MASLRHEAHWGCPAAVIETAVQNMRAAGVPKFIADALYEAQMPKPTAKAKVYGISPEPAPTDCMTCCDPFAKEKLIKFRHEIFHRRIKIELEKMKLTEWAPKEALAESQLKVSIASPRGARVYTQATECFSSTWTPRSTAGSVLLS